MLSLISSYLSSLDHRNVLSSVFHIPEHKSSHEACGTCGRKYKCLQDFGRETQRKGTI